MIFEEKKYFYLLFLLPVIWGCFWWLMHWKKKQQQKFANKERQKWLYPEKSIFKLWLKLWVFSLAIVSLIIGLANPKIGSELQEVKLEGVDMVFAIDVSKSMLAEDVKPSRLEKSKRIISEIIANLVGDRVAFVPYAGQAVPLLPLTADYSVAKMFLHNLSTDVLSSQGTASVEALQICENYLQKEETSAKIIFLVSDGEDHQDGAVEKIKQLQQQGVYVFTIGLGTEKGAPIPYKENGASALKRDKNGEIVITKLNKSLLVEMATLGSGAFIDGNLPSQEVVQQVKKNLEKIEKTEYKTQFFSDYKSQFQWFIALALLLLVADMFISYKKTSWLQRLNLFNEKNQNK